MINTIFAKVMKVLQGAIGLSEEGVLLLGSMGSPFTLSVQIALALKGIEYKLVPDNYPFYKQIPVLIPNMKPTLVHNKKSISESLVILEYIDETWNQNSIFPSDPYQRAMVRFWSKFIIDKCVAAALQSVLLVNEEELKMRGEELLNALQFLENELKDKFFGGEDIGIVDIAALFIPLLQEVAGFQLFTKRKFPKLHKWSREVYNHPIVKENMPSKEQHFAYFKDLTGELPLLFKLRC